ncbi:MAG TPA: serine hydrolase domain-containing protein [Streptosporangiaceae bacterium]|nr:serine hydrolase domain-containing protein [Streptosporangiaceae bacterium]
MAHGLTKTGLDQLRAIAERHASAGYVPGLVVLVSSGGQTHVEALGALSFGGGAPVTRDSLFRIASITKPVTGAVTMALIEEGLIGLDEPVDRLLPELADRRVLRAVAAPLDDTVPAERAITTRDLLTFTFGFGFIVEMFMAAEPLPVVVASDEARLATIGPPDPAIQPDPDTWIAGLGSLPLIAQPGERWMYNTGASVLGVLASRAAGQSFGEVLRTRIFEPLGMTQTGFWSAETGRLATAYRTSTGPDAQLGVEAWDSPDGKYSRQPAFEDGAGGLVSTADDLLAFARMFLRGGDPVLSADSVRAMTTDQLTPEQKARGGLGDGFFNGQSWSFCQAVQDDGTFGWDGGFGSTWRVDPVRDLVTIVLTQRMFDGPALPSLHSELQDAAYAALA